MAHARTTAGLRPREGCGVDGRDGALPDAHLVTTFQLPRIRLPRTSVNKPVLWSWAMKRTGALKPQFAVTEITRRPLAIGAAALVARVLVRVGKGLACYGDKLPAVRAGAEVKLENTRGASLY